MKTKNRTYFDLAIGEAGGNGGDLLYQKNDMVVVRGNENQVYLALFGGNVEQDTPTQTVAGEQRRDWWGNSLFFPNNQAKQFNSKTERTLNSTVLNSAGRLNIENSVKEDLKFMADLGARVEVSVQITGQNSIKINISTIWRDLKTLTVFEFKKTEIDGNVLLVNE